MASETWDAIRTELAAKFPEILKASLMEFVDVTNSEVLTELGNLAAQYERYLERLQGGDPNAAETIRFIEARVETLLVSHGLSLSYVARQTGAKVLSTVLTVVERIATILLNRFLGPV